MEASTDGYIAAVAFPLVLMRITYAAEELAVIRILKTYTILKLAHLLFESTGSVSKRLIPSLRRREVVIPVLERLSFERIAILIYSKFRTLAGRNEVFINVGIDREAVVVIKRELIRSTQAEVSRDERRGVVLVIRNLTTEVGDIQTEREVRGTHRELKRLTIVESYIGCHRPTRIHLHRAAGVACVYAIIHIRIEEAHRYCHRHIFVELTRVGEVECPLVRSCVYDGVTLKIRKLHLTK